MTNRLTTVKANLRNTLARYRALSQLEADLATYTSEADIYELYAIMANYPAGETDEMRRIVQRRFPAYA